MGVDQIRGNLESVILDEKNMGVCPFPGQLECHPYDPLQVNPPARREVTLPLVITAGLIDGINPCAFAVLIFLLAFLLEVSGSRRRMIKAAAVYVIAVYLSYLLAGFGILSVIKLTGYANTIVKVAAAVAIVAGLINIKDYFWYGRGISLAIPESQKKNIESLVHKANVPAAVALGLLVSMVELPCTGGVYLAVLALLAESVSKANAVIYLLAYNLMFVLPLIIITTLVVAGMKAHHLEKWRQGKREWMKLALGLFMVALGVWMLAG
jgi:cytochrome c biogenesis protein CcdA